MTCGRSDRQSRGRGLLFWAQDMLCLSITPRSGLYPLSPIASIPTNVTAMTRAKRGILHWNENASPTYEELKVKHYNPCCHKEFSLRHLRCDLSAPLRHSSEQPFSFTTHYTGHRESAYFTVNVTQFSHRALNPILTGNSHKIFAIRQKMDVELCWKWAKSRRVETFWIHAVSSKSGVC
jgi:hypothetical protein